MTLSIQEIQRDPGAFVGRVQAGESFVVVQGEHSVAEVRPVQNHANGLRPVGLSAGRFSVPDDFDASIPDDILKEFEGA